MTKDQIEAINTSYATCTRLVKGLIVAGRVLGKQLNALLPEIAATLSPTRTEDEFFAAQDGAWLTAIWQQCNIPPEISLVFADFSILPEVQAAPALPAQSMALYDALRLMAYLIPALTQSADEYCNKPEEDKAI